MDQGNLLIVAMVEKCRELIAHAPQTTADLPPALRPKHLLWMCDKIEEQAESWPATRMHRWIGFVQGGMIANHILRLDEVKTMFDVAKNSFGARNDDQDLLDHLDAETAFEMEIGGQG
jgi:hypothetical protein